MVLFPVSAITNATLNLTLNTYSLQDALSPSGFDSIQAEDYGYITRYLFDTGCQYDGVQNCTAACQDPGSAFSTLDTLHNCMMYPIIADQYAKNNLSSDIAQLAQSLGIEKSTWPSAVSLNITNTISSCLVAYCATLEECMPTAVTYNESYYGDGEYDSMFTNSTGPFYFDLGPRQGSSEFDLCEYLPASVNQDIGGIGVYVSYWIQTGICLLAFLMIIWWEGVVYYSRLTISTLSSEPSRRARAQRSRSQDRTVRLAALTSALVDFHKAQCFFVLAINIAAQVDRAKGGLQPQSLQQLYNTWVLIKSISIGGYLPVTFTLLTLHLVDQVSWYLLSLTICTVAVAIATLVTIGNFNPSDGDISSVNLASSTNGPIPCGERNPGAWCYIPNSLNSGPDPSDGAYSMLYLCVFVLLLLTAKQLGLDSYLSNVCRQKIRKYFPKDRHIERWYSTRRRGFIAAWEVFRTIEQKISEHRKTKQLRRFFAYHISWKPLSQQELSWSGPSRTKSEWFTKVTESTSKKLRIRGLLAKEAIIKMLKVFRSADWLAASQLFLIVLFYATILGIYICFFTIFCGDLAWFASNGVSNTWSFGQIVAITVWAQPLCEYIHLEIRGIQRGFDHRLPAPYKVVKGDAKGEESMSDEKRADKDKAENGEELAVLSTANSSAIQPYPSSATNGVYEQARDLDTPENERLSESNALTNSGYDRVERQEEFMPLEVNLPEEEEDITWQMSELLGPERVPSSYD